MTIKTIDELLELFPNVQDKGGGEISMPCPLCPPQNESAVETYQGRIFVGEDRMVMRQDATGMYCRKCHQARRGRGGSGFHPIDDIAYALSIELSARLELDLTARKVTTPQRALFALWGEGQVEEAHQNRDDNYWRSFGWNAATIKRFKLGKGTLYPRHPDMHLIPMMGVVKPGSTPLDKYYMSSRGMDENGKAVKERSPGSAKPYMWLIEDDLESTTIVVVEGEKDAISTWHIGFRNVAVSYGATFWTKEKSQYLFEKGYDNVIILGDADEAGKSFNRHVAAWCSEVGFPQTGVIDWDNIPTNSKDVTELLQAVVSINKAKKLITNSLYYPIISTTGGVTRAKLVRKVEDTPSPIDEEELISLEDLRGEGDNSILGRGRQFLETYDDEYPLDGGALHYRIAPGGGKTHALVKLAEEVALAQRKELEQVRAQMAADVIEFRDSLDDAEPHERRELEKTLEHMEKRLDDFSFRVVGWFGQYKEGFPDLERVGIDKDLWFNYEARSVENCSNYDVVQTLGRNHHDIGVYCHSGCPFAAQCKKTGYLAQEVKSRRYPIVYYRHQHLRGDYGKGTKLNILDEYTGSVWEDSPIKFRIDDVYPSYESWDIDLENPDMFQAIEYLTQAIRAAMSTNAGVKQRTSTGELNDNYIISGAELLELIDSYTRSIAGMSLEDVISRISPNALHTFYQPNYTSGDTALIRKRCVPFLFDVIQRELPDYVSDPDNCYPSCLHLVSGGLEVYASDKIAIPRTIPVIVADATGIPDIYGAMLKRRIEIFEPRFRNPNAEVTVVYGSDWTNSQIQSEIGFAIKDRRRQVRDKIMTLDGQEFDPASVPISTDIYHSRVVRHALSLIKGIAQKHESVLVVTHKNLKELLESIVKGAYPEDDAGKILDGVLMAWGHYGALRGTNAYEDFEAVILVGAFRIPYDAMWRRIQMWAWLLGIKDEIPADTILSEQAYHGQDMGFGYRTFEHWFADEYVNMVETGELVQSAERIRPHSTSTKKYVYILASRPALRFVTQVISKTELLKEVTDSKTSEAKSFMKKWYKVHGRLPPYRMVATEFSMSNSDIKLIRKQLEQELKIG